MLAAPGRVIGVGAAAEGGKHVSDCNEFMLTDF